MSELLQAVALFLDSFWGKVTVTGVLVLLVVPITLGRQTFNEIKKESSELFKTMKEN